MISIIWISQTALRFTDSLLLIIAGIVLLFCIVFRYRADEEGIINAMLQNIIVGTVWLLLSKFMNKSTMPQDEIPVVKNQNENKKKKENPPPEIVQNTKKKPKKAKRSPKKSYSNKENKEPAVAKQETEMHPVLDIYYRLNRDNKSIYDILYQYTLTDQQLKINQFPREGYHPRSQVEANDTKRICARCGGDFEIFQDCVLSSSKCNYHPRKATFAPGSSTRIHGCCNRPFGFAPCAVSNCHVTVQHRPRALTKTPSRRHVKRERQHNVYSLDCEMCYTTDGLEVVRVALVNLEGVAVYDGYVKPKSKILDYNTMYSGVDKSHLQNVNVRLEDVKKILEGWIQEDTILVGHALNNDLAVLGLIHGTIVDTSVLYADPINPSKKMALKKLASEYLGLKIQDGESGHDCIDDARATLQLALLKVPPALTEPLPKQQSNWSYDQAKEKAEQPVRWPEIQNIPNRFQIKGEESCDSNNCIHDTRHQAVERPFQISQWSKVQSQNVWTRTYEGQQQYRYDPPPFVIFSSKKRRY